MEMLQNVLQGRQQSVPVRRQHNQLKTQLLPNGDHRVIRSEVWNCFDLEGLNAVCRACNERLKVGPTRQTSSLWRHLKRHSREVQERLLKPLLGQGLTGRSANHMAARTAVYGLQNGIIGSGSHFHRTVRNKERGAEQHFQQQQHQQFIGEDDGGGVFSDEHLLSASAACSSSSSQMLSGELMMIGSPADDAAASGPSVTVDCRLGQNLDLEQLLGIRTGESSDSAVMAGANNFAPKQFNVLNTVDEEEEEEDEGQQQQQHLIEVGNDDNFVETLRWRKGKKNDDGVEEEVEDEGEEGFGRVLVEFLLENALPFNRVLVHSPALREMLRLSLCPPFLAQTPLAQQQKRRRTIPSPEVLMSKFLPRMFAEVLDERKAHFVDDFFVLNLCRTRVDGAPKGTSILRISAVKLGEGFGLCSRCLGVFAFRGGLRQLIDTLRRCFEEGRAQLKLWQVSAVVHDGSSDFVELCRQLELPGIPSARFLLRNVYNELDKLEFSAECVRRVKGRFKRAISSAQGGGHFSAFSLAVPLLISLADSFFSQNLKQKEEKLNEDNEEEEEEEVVGEKTADLLMEQRLLEKFHTLWQFQRERLLSDPTAQMSIFLNPSFCHHPQGPFDADQWARVEASVIEEICQAFLPQKASGNHAAGEEEVEEADELELRAEIEAEVKNYVESTLFESQKKAASEAFSDNYEYNEATVGGVKQQPVPHHQQSLSELLIWWRTHLERFPRVGHLARQFCAIPLCAETGSGGGWSQSGGAGNGSSPLPLSLSDDQRNANYASELLGTDLTGERDEHAALDRLSQLLTIRIAVLEKNACATAAAATATFPQGARNVNNNKNNGVVAPETWNLCV